MGRCVLFSRWDWFKMNGIEAANALVNGTIHFQLS
jgi:hypothetical protein